MIYLARLGIFINIIMSRQSKRLRLAYCSDCLFLWTFVPHYLILLNYMADGVPP
jgi:hypothetical protein